MVDCTDHMTLLLAPSGLVYRLLEATGPPKKQLLRQHTKRPQHYGSHLATSTFAFPTNWTEWELPAIRELIQSQSRILVKMKCLVSQQLKSLSNAILTVKKRFCSQNTLKLIYIIRICVHTPWVVLTL